MDLKLPIFKILFCLQYDKKKNKKKLTDLKTFNSHDNRVCPKDSLQMSSQFVN